jgi:hypothetical protein
MVMQKGELAREFGLDLADLPICDSDAVREFYAVAPGEIRFHDIRLRGRVQIEHSDEAACLFPERCEQEEDHGFGVMPLREFGLVESKSPFWRTRQTSEVIGNVIPLASVSNARRNDYQAVAFWLVKLCGVSSNLKVVVASITRARLRKRNVRIVAGNAIADRISLNVLRTSFKRAPSSKSLAR